MEYRDLEESHQEEIRNFLGLLVQENQRDLLKLMADGIIPWSQTDFLATCSISESEFDAMLEQIISGANPFETWMLANGYSQEVIDKIYEIIDNWLVKNGLRLPVRSTDPNLN